jgi:hypothetical protein
MMHIGYTIISYYQPPQRHLVQILIYKGDRIYLAKCATRCFRSAELARGYAERYFYHYRIPSGAPQTWYIGELPARSYWLPPTVPIRAVKRIKVKA